jgi:branched-chain amino acid transport system permease protein
VTTFLQLLFDGLSGGAVYALIAVGVTVIFGLTGIVNFAHGQFVMIGAYLSWQATALGVHLFLAIGIAFVVMTLVGFALERGVFSFTLQKPITGFIVSLGLVPMTTAIVIMIWGSDARVIEPLSREVWSIAGLRFPSQRVLTILVAVTLLAGLFILLSRSQTGRSLRAAAQDRRMASALGVNVPLLSSVTFAAATGLAGVAGGLAGALYTISPEFGAGFVFKAFIIVLLGGLGNIAGTAIAAFGIGLTESLLARYGLYAWSDAVVIVIVLAVLLWRPTGLFRGSEIAHD